MTSVLSVRPTQVYDLPLPSDVVLLQPEQVILRFSHGKTIDVGALCFFDRDTRSTPRRAGKPVLLKSLCPKRVRHVRKLINQISFEVRHSGLRVETLRDIYSRFIAFMAWADAHGHQNILATKDEARPAVSAYIAHLRQRVRKMELTINSAARQQAPVLMVLENYHDIQDLGRGLNLLYKEQAAKSSTKPPCETAQSRVLSLCGGLFWGICDLILTPRPFPYGIKMPSYIGLRDDTLWLFPSISWFMSPAMLAERHTMWCPGWAYNYSEGRLAILEELRAVNFLPGQENFAGNSDSRRGYMLSKARRQLAVANKNDQHCQRRQVAFQAMNTFCILFLAQTGMNWAQVTELEWSEDFEISASHQAFRTIKWRAGGKLVSFELPVSFIPKFKRYLDIRKYLLNGQACDRLFFKQGTKGGNLVPAPFKSNLDRVYPSLPRVTSREWRAAKSDWLVRNTDPSTAAIVLQNSEQTVLQSYAEGSESLHLAEMSTFLNEVGARVLPKGVLVDGGVARAVGICASFGVPAAIGAVAVLPDCKRPEGCLFCDKFKVHADARDTRKLLSCRYCLRQATPLARSDEQIEALLAPIFHRIAVILDEVRKRDPKMVERVTQEVEEYGELDPYWAKKYDMLVSLGVVT
jgi:hypothetical protein